MSTSSANVDNFVNSLSALRGHFSRTAQKVYNQGSPYRAQNKARAAKELNGVNHKQSKKETPSATHSQTSRKFKEDKEDEEAEEFGYHHHSYVPETSKWNNKLDYIVVAIGYAVGISNVSTFPALCYKYGAMTFIITYLIAVLVIGLPALFLEISLGQFTSSGFLNCWQFAPVFKGIGATMIVLNITFLVTYNVNVAMAFVYLVESLMKVQSKMPWLSCNNEFNTEFCREYGNTGWNNCSGSSQIFDNGTCLVNHTSKPATGIWNQSLANSYSISLNSSIKEYFHKFIQGTSEGIEDVGSVRWRTVVAYVGVWALLACFLFSGIKSLAKAMYVTTIIPIVLLLVLLIRSIINDEGYAARDFTSRLEGQSFNNVALWSDAVNRVVFSLSAGYGIHISLASHNSFRRNCFRDAVIICLVDTLFSIAGTFIMFSFLSYLVRRKGIVHKNLSGGDVIFVLIPEAISDMDPTILWACLLFIAIIFMALNSSACVINGMISSVLQGIPSLLKHESKVMIGFCLAACTLGLLFCTEGGVYLITFADYFLGGWTVLVNIFVELIAVAYVYGASRYGNHLGVMLGKTWCGGIPFNAFFWIVKVCWWFVTPAAILFLLAYSMAVFKTLSTEAGYQYPGWAVAFGYILTFICIIFMIISIFNHIICNKRDVLSNRKLLTQAIYKMFKPSKYWGPLQLGDRKYFKNEKDFVTDPFSTAGHDPENPDIILAQIVKKKKDAEKQLRRHSTLTEESTV